MDAFSLDVVEAKVAEEISKAGWSKETLRDIYEAEILDWTDNYDENLAGDAESALAVHARGAIAQLWLNYARMEATQRAEPSDEDRSAQVLENATHDPCGSRSLAVYTACLDALAGQAEKLREVYLRAVSQTLLPEHDAQALWGRFLLWARAHTGRPDLTMEQLRGDAQGISASAAASDSPSALTGEARGNGHAGEDGQRRGEMDVTPPSSDDEDDGPAPASTPAPTAASAASALAAALAASNESKAADEEKDKMEIKKEEEEKEEEEDEGPARATITPEMLIKRHSRRPPMLLQAPHKEPMLSAVSSLTPEELASLETYTCCPLLMVRERAGWLLDLLEGLWTAQALQERAHDQWFGELRSLHGREEADLTRRHANAHAHAKSHSSSHNSAHPSNSSGSGTAAAATPKQQQETEKRRLKAKCLVQLELLHASINEAQLSLLRLQMEVLCDAGFPLASISVYEKVEAAVIGGNTAGGAATGLGGGGTGTNTGSIISSSNGIGSSSGSGSSKSGSGLGSVPVPAEYSRLQLLLGALLNARMQPAVTFDAAAKKAGAGGLGGLGGVGMGGLGGVGAGAGVGGGEAPSDPRKRKRFGAV